MSPVNLSKVVEARKPGRRSIGTIYKRTRYDRNGHWELPLGAMLG